MTTVIAALAGANTINQMMYNVNQIRSGITFSSNTAIRVPFGTTAQRPTAVAGAFRYNTQTGEFEGYTGAGWGSIGGGGLGVFKLIAGSYSANSGDRLAVSTTAAGRTITLPGSPSADDIIEFIDKDSSFAINNLTISRNGSTIEGSSANLVADISSTNFFMQYSGSTWEVFGISSGETTVGADLTGTTSTATFSAAGLAKIALANTNAYIATKQNTLPVNFSTANLTTTGTATIGGAAGTTFGTNIWGSHLQSVGGQGIASLRASGDAFGGALNLAGSRGTFGSPSIVLDNDALGAVYFDGFDGGDYNSYGASIVAYVDGTPGVNDMPARLVFSTSADGSNTPTERVRIAAAGDVTIEETLVAKKGMPIRVAGGNNVVLALSDNGKLLMCTNTASAMSVRIPNNSAVAFPIGAEISLVNVLTHATANTLGIAQTAGVILQSKEAANTVADRYTSATLKKTATNTWLLIGNLA